VSEKECVCACLRQRERVKDRGGRGLNGLYLSLCHCVLRLGRKLRKNIRVKYEFRFDYFQRTTKCDIFIAWK